MSADLKFVVLKLQLSSRQGIVQVKESMTIIRHHNDENQKRFSANRICKHIILAVSKKKKNIRMSQGLP